MDRFDHSIELGTITLKGKVQISDPCYGTNVWCSGSVRVKPGNYRCYADVWDCGDWGMRIGKIVIAHESKSYTEDKVALDFQVGVDSGQCGIFDRDYYYENHGKDDVDDEWYNKVCGITLSDERCGVIDGLGVVGESGYGDGGYVAYVRRNEKNEITYVEVEFIFEDDEEDEWEEEEMTEEE